MNEDFLHRKLKQREEVDALRKLKLPDGKVDFCSNDYLGIATNALLNGSEKGKNYRKGSAGSRLLAGNYALIESAEKIISSFHNAEAGLIFNSGYDANLGLLSAIPQRGDTIIYDYLCHASIRDGIRLSFANSFAFEHNNIDDLEKKLKQASGNVFVVTESVFSMDGDTAPLKEISVLCESKNAALIVDEAHATGVVGSRGEGLVQTLGLEKKCFARVHTFGKALGSHGSIVLGSSVLRDYCINFSRSFIYTTSLPESAIGDIIKSYEVFPLLNKERTQLTELIKTFQSITIKYKKLKSDTPIQVIIIPGNTEVKAIASRLQEAGLDVRAILYPTVPAGGERLRITLHSFNKVREIELLAELLG